MLNRFQHLIKSIYYETLKRLQGDKKMDYDIVSKWRRGRIKNPSKNRRLLVDG